MGIPPTGERLAIQGIIINHLANGKIVEEWAIRDTPSLLQELGVVPRLEDSPVGLPFGDAYTNRIAGI